MQHGRRVFCASGPEAGLRRARGMGSRGPSRPGSRAAPGRAGGRSLPPRPGHGVPRRRVASASMRRPSRSCPSSTHAPTAPRPIRSIIAGRPSSRIPRARAVPTTKAARFDRTTSRKRDGRSRCRAGARCENSAGLGTRLARETGVGRGGGRVCGPRDAGWVRWRRRIAGDRGHAVDPGGIINRIARGRGDARRHPDHRAGSGRVSDPDPPRDARARGGGVRHRPSPPFRGTGEASQAPADARRAPFTPDRIRGGPRGRGGSDETRADARCRIGRDVKW
jgi:hypothetical protein